MKPKNRNALTDLALRRPVTMLMLFLSMLVIGAVSWVNIPLALLPQGLDLPYLWMWFVYPNASPVENLERIGKPVEESLWTVKGVRQIYTRSDESRCRVQIEFDQSIDMDNAYLEVQDRIERVRPDLPEDLRYIYVYRYSESDDPILYFGISVTGNYEDPYRVIKDDVVRKLEQVDGVATVEMWGGVESEVRIELILDKLKAYNLDANSLIRKLSAADFAVAGGTVIDGGNQLFVRSDGRIKNLDELKRLPVRGENLLLGDIALVTYSPPPKKWIQRIDRTESVQIGVYKESGVNSFALNEELNRLLDGMRADPHLSGLRFDILFDQGKYIRDSVLNLQEAGLWGGLFAICVLFFFLRRVRMTLFITLAIPLSLLVTVVVMYFIGWSLNIVTLSGLMICVGLVVDNAIVVVENIHRKRQQGLEPKLAAIIGTGEVGQAITISTLTTAVVFLPMILMGDNRIMSFYLLRIGLPVIIALAASLMTALLFVPLAVNKLAMEGPSKESKLISNASEWVGALVSKVLKRRLDTFLILLLLLASTAIPLQKVVSTDQEEGHINDFRLSFTFPSYYTLERVDSTMANFENIIYSNGDQYNLKTVVTGLRRGYGRMRIFMNEDPDQNWAIAGVKRWLYDLKLMKRPYMTRKQIVEDIKEKVTAPPGVKMRASWDQGRSEDNTTYVTIFGDDSYKLLTIAEDMTRRLELIDGVLAVEPDLESSSDEVQIRFDRTRTAHFTVDPAQTAAGLATLVRGINLPDIRIGDREVTAHAELRESDRETLRQVMNLPVSTGSDDDAKREVRLDDVAKVGYGHGLGEIRRENRRTRMRLKITTLEDDIGKLSDKIDANLEGLSLPTGYEWSKGRRFQSVAEASGERNQAWLLAVTFVLLLLGALFESFLLPWCVIITVPFSFFGVWWFLYATGTQFGIMAGIGVIILIGIVVNNAIVLVDHANRLISEGIERDTALSMASKSRFRPIVMTALTTVMGLIPMAMGDANLIGIPYAPMGRAIIGGMLTATLSTPIVVPLVYSVIDDMRKRFRSRVIW